ncbi:ribose ABC transporter permease [Kaistia algarum]|uniref:ABC transporter permease n=1 Tax=Kaistia algarum TaxID=2083279 RepID=UPI000CE8C7AE|nr:ABC transporter permease [Kaistia algarum]MCX5515351.1 ABC transporter permease [Kaistia algarum]PPE77851.1 ribose ABC transporter permease [Kaistia algarum]
MSLSESAKPQARFDFSRGGGIFIAFILLCAVLSFATPYFLTFDNLVLVARQSVFIMIVALAMTFVIAMGGIDLSVGSTMAAAGMLVAALLDGGVPTGIAVPAALGFGLLIGLTNGLLIAGLGMADFIVTLGTMSVLRGLIMVYSQGVPIFGLRVPAFQYLAQGYIGPLPVPVLIGIALFGVCAILLYRTEFGRRIIAIGSNARAAALVGVPLGRTRITVYALCGLFSAIAGILLTSRLEAAMPEAAMGNELDVIAAVVIGGTRLSGGRAILVGTVIGALVMGVVRNGLTLLQVNTFWHQVVIGAIILLAVAIDRYSSRRSRP